MAKRALMRVAKKTLADPVFELLDPDPAPLDDGETTGAVYPDDHVAVSAARRVIGVASPHMRVLAAATSTKLVPAVPVDTTATVPSRTTASILLPAVATLVEKRAGSELPTPLVSAPKIEMKLVQRNALSAAVQAAAVQSGLQSEKAVLILSTVAALKIMLVKAVGGV